MVESKNITIKKIIAFVGSFWFIFAAVGVSVALATLTLGGSSITGDSNSTIDATGTISIGPSQATGIQIGHSNITSTFPGDVVVDGACSGCVTTNQNLRVQPVGFDGGGIALSGTDEVCTLIPESATLTAVDVVASCSGGSDCAGSATINVSDESFTNYISHGMAGASSVATATLSNAYASTDAVDISVGSNTIMCFTGSGFQTSSRIMVYPIITSN